MPLTLTALSPLDGRYAPQLTALTPFFSELALQKYRVKIELEYFNALAQEPAIKEIRPLTKPEAKFCRAISENFSLKDGKRLKAIEKKIQHDVKAVEYFLAAKLKKTSLKQQIPFLHFALTSEDVNNLAYALLIRAACQQVIWPQLAKLQKLLKALARNWSAIPLLARTHGQPATPTTLGHEFAVFAARIARQQQHLKQQQFLGKLNGATGNFAAHALAYPQVNWPRFAQKFIRKIGLTPNLVTTQIEPHDFLVELSNTLALLNTILLDLARDCWGYLARDLFQLKKSTAEVGSSTMPHKVNPINFENAEGNFGLANALYQFFAQKLPISRFQRDLSDSTVLRNFGVATGYALLGYQNLQTGLQKLQPHKVTLNKELADNPAVLAEAIQIILRKQGDSQGYEKLKKLTRGATTSLASLRQFIAKLALPTTEKQKLLNLTPTTYRGLKNFGI